MLFMHFTVIMSQNFVEVKRMKLGTTKAFTLGSLMLGLAVGLFGFFFLEEGSAVYIFAEIVTALLFAAGIITAVVWGRCPFCGKPLFYKLFKLNVCPRCKRRLDSKGKYASGKRKS